MSQSSVNDSSQPLVDLLARTIQTRNGIPFAEFMNQCLYHPEHGYYMVARDRIGKQGDFFTSTSVHSLFGRLIARQLLQMWELLGKNRFVIAEQGGGEGHLCLDILDALQEEAPEFYRKVDYLLVEISPDNRQRQEKLLQGHRQRLSWTFYDELHIDAGCLLSNELVDAMPVHLVEKIDGGLKEVYVVNRGDGFGEELRPLSTPVIEDYFLAIDVQPVEGNRFEVNLEAPRWIASAAEKLQRGFVLTIDYGYPAVELYAPFRRQGTLMCYHQHSASENPYERIGCQDMTAHVDFSALQIYGERAGLDSLYFGEQYRFLMGLGFLEELMRLQAKAADDNEARAIRMTLKNLIMPDGGMGETFKVLIQGKGVGRPELLCSRAIGDVPIV